MFKNLTIGKKLGVGFGVIIFLLVLSGIITIVQLYSAKNNIKDIDERIDKLNNAVSIRRAILGVLDNIKDIMLTENFEKKQELKKEIDQNRAIYKEKIEAIRKTTHTKEGEQLLKNLEDAIADEESANNKLIELAMAGKNKEAIEFYNRELPSKMAKIEKTIDEEVHFHREKLKARLAEINSIIAK